MGPGRVIAAPEAFVRPDQAEWASTKLQRAFRRRYYRFDRKLLIDRLRLEARLETLGGRLLLVFVLMVLVFCSLARPLSPSTCLKIQEDVDASIRLSSTFSKLEVYGVADLSAFLAGLPVYDAQAVAKPDTFSLVKSVAEVQVWSTSDCQAIVREFLSTGSSSSSSSSSSSFDMCGSSTVQSGPAFVTYVEDLVLNFHPARISLYFLFYSPVSHTHTLLEVELDHVPGSVKWQYLQQTMSVGSVGRATAVAAIVIAAVWIVRDFARVYGWLRAHLHKNRTEGAKLKALGGVTGSKRRLSLWLFVNLMAMVLTIVACAQSLSLSTVDPGLEFTNTDAAETFAQLIELKASYEDHEQVRALGVFVLYFLLTLLINCLAGHPRVGVLTDTWYSAKDEILHFILSFMLIFFTQAAVAHAVFSSKAPVFRSMTNTVNFQFELLWSGEWSSRLSEEQLDSLALQWYLIFFVLLIQLILLNFFTAILIESYMAVRHVIASTRFSQSFPADAWDSFVAKVLVKFGRLPRRQDVVSELIKMFATRTLNLENLGQTGLFGHAKADFSNPFFMRFLRFYRRYAFLQPTSEADDADDRDTALWQQASALLDVIQSSQRRTLQQVAAANESLQVRLAVLEDRLHQLVPASTNSSNS